ncbi:MAG: two pore domain potassium channel family protein [Gemmatimonadales bacterium]|nr:two pore domain potassium channel family protein [Gemmatimonadales bacterium]
MLKTLLTPGSRFGVLLTSLALMLFLPFSLPVRVESVLTPVLLTVVLLSSLSAVADNRRHVTIGTALAIPGCVLLVASSVRPSIALAIVAQLVALAFLAYVAILILGFILRAREVDLGIVLGSVCVYLLLALMWGVGFGLIERLDPGAFAIPSAGDGTARNALQYFSFVTITTLGYGDIQPVIPLARMLSVVEAVIGQLYLVILVARLVGLHTALESAKAVNRTTE